MPKGCRIRRRARPPGRRRTRTRRITASRWAGSTDLGKRHRSRAGDRTVEDPELPGAADARPGARPGHLREHARSPTGEDTSGRDRERRWAPTKPNDTAKANLKTPGLAIAQDARRAGSGSRRRRRRTEPPTRSKSTTAATADSDRRRSHRPARAPATATPRTSADARTAPAGFTEIARRTGRRAAKRQVQLGDRLDPGGRHGDRPHPGLAGAEHPRRDQTASTTRRVKSAQETHARCTTKARCWSNGRRTSRSKRRGPLDRGRRGELDRIRTARRKPRPLGRRQKWSIHDPIPAGLKFVSADLPLRTGTGRRRIDLRARRRCPPLVRSTLLHVNLRSAAVDTTGPIVNKATVTTPTEDPGNRAPGTTNPK